MHYSSAQYPFPHLILPPSLLRSGTNTLGIIFFCLTFGTVLGSLGKRAKVVIDFFGIIDEVIMKMVYGIMW